MFAKLKHFNIFLSVIVIFGILTDTMSTSLVTVIYLLAGFCPSVCGKGKVFKHFC